MHLTNREVEGIGQPSDTTTMITRIEANRYRCLLNASQRLGRFHALVGPIGSGTSSFLDVLHFLADMVRGREGVSGAVDDRAPDVRHLCWMRRGDSFEIAVEAAIPSFLRQEESDPHAGVRYEVRVGVHPDSGQAGLLAETLWLMPETRTEPEAQRELYPIAPQPIDTILQPPRHRSPTGWRKVVTKVPESGNDYFVAETSGWENMLRLGPRRSVLGNLPDDEERFPVAVWFRRLLLHDVHRLAPGATMHAACPPGAPQLLQPDCANLPWVAWHLSQDHPDRFERWIAASRRGLPGLKTIRTPEREVDRHRYIELEYENGLSAPSWLASDGSLRLLAFTVLAHLPDLSGVYLIDEPETGLHPSAVDTVVRALSRTDGPQVLVASHSPVVLGLADPNDILCFARTPEGTTDVVRGTMHPRLTVWRDALERDALLATGVLG